MNTLYALMIVTSVGVSEGYTFASLEDCNTASNRVRDSFCVAKIPVKVNVDIDMGVAGNMSLDRMFDLLQQMKTRMEKLQ
jgi:hypothetical protein